MKSLALSYALKKRQKMAKGGMPSVQGKEGYENEEVHNIGDAEMDQQMKHELGEHELDREVHAIGDQEKDAMATPKPQAHMDYEAEGGDIVGRIMKKRCYAKGGMVADEMSAEFDDPDEHQDFHETGKNSGDELGDEAEDHDRHDIVAKIMRSRAKKDRNPRPA